MNFRHIFKGAVKTLPTQWFFFTNVGEKYNSISIFVTDLQVYAVPTRKLGNEWSGTLCIAEINKTVDHHEHVLENEPINISINDLP